MSEKKNFAGTSIKTDSCSLLFPIAATFFVIAKSYQFSWFIVCRPIMFMEATDFINSAHKTSLHLLNCLWANSAVPGGS